MPRILYLIGRQGSGKSTLAGLIARGTSGGVAHLTPEEVPRKTSLNTLRVLHGAARLIIIEANSLDEKLKAQLQPGDSLLHLETLTQMAAA